jgi:hypothetical protein
MSRSFKDLYPQEQEIIKRERGNQRDFPKPEAGRIYSPKYTQDGGKQ